VGEVGSTRHHVEQNPRGKRLVFLTIAALGIVYGDIGTSPLYTFEECFREGVGGFGLLPTPENVLGILSLIFWELVLVVSIKYCVFILRADNRGEGGILALLALALKAPEKGSRKRMLIIMLGLFGAALLFGDGMITPAITVLSAVEGVAVKAPALQHIVVPVAVAIIVGLFLLQRFGTARVGSAFGPVTVLWFLTIGALGISQVTQNPAVLRAVNPLYAVDFFLMHGFAGFIVLGAVLLAITGAEALYADLGHFGKRPIRLGWFGLALPCLLLNYFGQGALLLRVPGIEKPFYQMAPDSVLIPLTVLATAAAIIASQAMISGTFSIAQQCVQLGYSPRVTIVHTSAREAGQIYVPEINKALMVGCLIVTIGFGSAAALSAAYGIAVLGTMSVTCTLFSLVAVQKLGWKRWRALLFLAVFLTIDLTLFAAATLKIPHGGWFPLATAVVIFAFMTTWKRGRLLLRDRLNSTSLPIDVFLDDIGRNPRTRVSGTAVFMTSEPTGVPTVLLHHLKHNKVLHDQIILLSIMPDDVPEVSAADRIHIEPLEHGFFRVVARYGFMEKPDVKELLALCNQNGIRTRPLETSYYLGRERLIPVRRKRGDTGLRLALWRKKLFAFMSRNAISATEYFGIPPNRVVELGTQVEI
jgi:KUP system potassium uptake protein